jgi:hypothetical protein
MPTNWGSRSFNGTTDKIATGNQTASNPITISAWINPSAAQPTAYGTVFSISNNSTAVAQLLLKTTGKLATYLTVGGNSKSIDPGSVAISNNIWTHVLVVSDTSTLNLYVNGSLDTLTGFAVAVASTSGIASGIGEDPGTNASFFQGSIADVAFWNVALTTAEISALAKGARPSIIRPKSLSGWWPLDGLQSPEPDLSGNAKNGTLTGTTPAFGPPYAPFTPRWPQGLDVVAAPTFIPAWAMGKNIVVEGVAT